MRPPGDRGDRASRQPVRSAASFSMSISGTVPHRPVDLALSRRRFRGSGSGVQRVSLIAPGFGRSAIFTQSRQRQRVVAARRARRASPPHPGDERRRVQRLAQLRVVLGAAGVEVAGQVLVRVAEPVGADHPDLLASQLLAQRLEGARPRTPCGPPGAGRACRLVRQVRPVAATMPACTGTVSPGRVVCRCPRRVAARSGPARRCTGRCGLFDAELQHLQQPDQALAVVVGVGGPHRGLHRAPVRRALATCTPPPGPAASAPRRTTGNTTCPHRVVRRGPARLAIAEQQVLLARAPA